jgi:hypothetical protein
MTGAEWLALGISAAILATNRGDILENRQTVTVSFSSPATSLKTES